MTIDQADIGLIGLAVMGQNLVLNMNDHGYKVVVFNRTVSKVEQFLSKEAKGTQVRGAYRLEEFFQALKRPRKVLLMVKAGGAVDALIEECLPYLEQGDILMDGGNSHYLDSERRMRDLQTKGILFLGVGISGGEEGARSGPSLMPGGNKEAWPFVKELLQSIAARAEDGSPCCDWVGEGGAGHYVKMVHNGIEYGDMQLIGEAYHLLQVGASCSPRELEKIFGKWNEGVLHSYLIEITSRIFGYREEDGTFLVDKILDAAGQKGTGKWTGISALDLGVPLTLIAEAVFARCLSALKEQRGVAAREYGCFCVGFKGDKEKLSEAVHQALYASKIISYAQGFMLLQAEAEEMGWQLDYGAIALMWRGGCIIRSRFLNNIQEAFGQNPQLPSLLLDPFFKEALLNCEKGWREAVIAAVELGVPVPCFSTALAFFDGYRTERLPANLLQAQRDFFGAHTYERVDRPRGEFFHTNWTGTGGTTTSSTYSV